METKYVDGLSNKEDYEANRQYYLEKFWDNITPEQEEKLQKYFNEEVRELGGVGITKDNCEDLFENWSAGLSLSKINKILNV